MADPFRTLESLAEELTAVLRPVVAGAVLPLEPLAAHTTLKVGGPAAVLVRAEEPADLAAVARACAGAGVEWLMVGRGSNLLVADDGWPGVAITLGRGFRGVSVGSRLADGDGARVAVTAGAAEPMPVLARTVAAAGLGGLAFGVAIPGTLGGAVRMNAGAHGAEVADVLVWADVALLGSGGSLRRLAAADLRMRYRTTALPPDAVVVQAGLALQPAPEVELAADMAEMRRWRRAHQPINQPSCGSVFRNPPHDSAGRLIEAAGMKGYRVGKAQISEAHANFVTVTPGACAGDVYGVLTDVRAAVARSAGVDLRPEVVLVGFPQAQEAVR